MPSRLWQVAASSFKLGLTSFGGPIAHIGYFFDEYVKRRQWLTDRAFADLVALCQFLPGPASSQLGMAIGLQRAGLAGAVVAWLGFTLPSALVLWGFAAALQALGAEPLRYLHGLLIAAVAVVAQAVWTMGQKFASRRSTGALALGAAAAVSLWTAPYAQLIVLAVAGLVGWFAFRRDNEGESIPEPRLGNPAVGLGALVLFFLLLAGLPALAAVMNDRGVGLAAGFYQAGALVFGGGHVVLPLLQQVVVPPGWVTNDQFLAGYGVAQAVPGPLFTFASYLGALALPAGGGALVATLAIFLPAFLLVVGVVPFWNRVRVWPRFRGALTGVNAAVVGLLLAALYHPVWTSAVRSPIDFALTLAAIGMLMVARLPSWVVVLGAAAAGALSLQS